MNIGSHINLGNLTSDPASPQNGWIWYNSTLGKFRKRESDVTSDIAVGGGPVITLGKIIGLQQFKFI